MKTVMPVITRFASGTHQAREAIAKGLRCSCTSGEDAAAEALARKFHGPKAVVKRVAPYATDFQKQHATLEVATADDVKNLQDLKNRGITHIIIR